MKESCGKLQPLFLILCVVRGDKAKIFIIVIIITFQFLFRLAYTFNLHLGSSRVNDLTG